MNTNNSGIYKISNLINKKIYIGSSCNLQKRKTSHFNNLLKNKHHSMYLQRAYNKYGKDSFIFEVIEFCTKESLKNREQFYIDNLKPEYNISLDATAPMMDRKHSSETIEKFKKVKRISGKDHYMFGQKWSEDRREKMIKSRIGQKRSNETKEKQRIAAINRNSHNCLMSYIEKRKRKIIDNKGNYFNSLSSAAKYWGISVSSVCDNLKGRSKKTYIGVIFFYDNS